MRMQRILFGTSLCSINLTPNKLRLCLSWVLHFTVSSVTIFFVDALLEFNLNGGYGLAVMTPHCG